MAEWAQDIEGALKASVIDRYKASLRMVEPVLINLHLDEIDTRTIAKLVKHRREQGSTNATIKRDLTAVASVIRFCCAKGWQNENPAHAYDRSVIRERRDPIVLPNLEDIDAIVEAATGNMKGIIRLAQYTGMRQGEVVNLTWSQVRGGVIDLSKTKTDKPRTIPLNDSARGTLKGTERHKESDVVFWVGKGTTYQNLASGFRHLIREAVKEKRVKRAFRFHDLRHLFAVDYLRNGTGTIYTLQKLLGHSSIKTTELYLNFLTPDEQEKVK